MHNGELGSLLVWSFVIGGFFIGSLFTSEDDWEGWIIIFMLSAMVAGYVVVSLITQLYPAVPVDRVISEKRITSLKKIAQLAPIKGKAVSFPNAPRFSRSYTSVLENAEAENAVDIHYLSIDEKGNRRETILDQSRGKGLAYVALKPGEKPYLVLVEDIVTLRYSGKKALEGNAWWPKEPGKDPHTKVIRLFREYVFHIPESAIPSGLSKW